MSLSMVSEMDSAALAGISFPPPRDIVGTPAQMLRLNMYVCMYTYIYVYKYNAVCMYVCMYVSSLTHLIQ